MRTKSAWYVYIIETTCNKFYTGITTDVQRRFNEHMAVFSGTGKKGAKFFRGHQPKQIIFQELQESRSSASKREIQIKSMTKTEKLGLLTSVNI